MPSPSCGFECGCHLPREFAAARGGCVKRGNGSPSTEECPLLEQS